MSDETPPLKSELLKSILYQVLRGLLWGWAARGIAKGYFTSGQAEYLLIGMVSVVMVAFSTVATSFVRYARALALRRLPEDATPETVSQLTWQILWRLMKVVPE